MGWWFGRKAVEPVQPFVPAWLTGEGEQGGYVRGYEAQLDEVYRRNPVGMRAVRLVAGLVGGLPLFAEDGDGQAVELVRSGGLMERTAAALLLHGNAYVRLVADGHDRPAEMHCMRPERVSVVSGADGWPAAYLYRAGGQVTRIAKKDVLQRIDMMLCPIVEGLPASSPPTSPVIGSCYLVAAGATGAWSGHDHALACFTDGGWRFVTPIDGMCLVDRASGQTVARRNDEWELGVVRGQEVQIDGQTVLRNRQAAIANPAGGGIIDTECRTAVGSILSALSAHGLIG